MIPLEEFEKLSLSEMIDTVAIVDGARKELGVFCNDGLYFAIKTGKSYSTPGVLKGPYTKVGLRLADGPPIWRVYQNIHSWAWYGVYRNVPIEQVTAFIAVHGGIDMKRSYAQYLINKGYKAL